MITLHHINGYIQTILLAEYANKLLLLDGCSRPDVSLLTRYITTTLKRPMSDLALVVVTHMHPDHAGAAQLLRKRFGCKIAAANVPGQWYSGIDGKLMHLSDMALTLWLAKHMKIKRMNVYYSATLYPDYYLDDQTLLPGFDDWRVLFTQGHTDRDVSLHHLPSNQVYVADLMVKVRSGFIPPYPVFFPSRYRQSLNKIISLNADKVILAHGGTVEPSAEQWQQLLERAPTIPVTHWRSVKAKFKRLFS